MGRIFVTTGSFVLGLVFIATGLAKVVALGQFALGLSHMFALSIAVASPCAAAVVAGEILGGAGLFIPPARRISAALLSILLIGFLALLSRSFMAGEDLPCDCFGIIGLHIPIKIHLLVDLGLLCIALVVATTPIETLDARTEGRLHQTFVVVALGAGLGIAALDVPQPAAVLSSLDVKPLASFLGAARAVQGRALVLLVDASDFHCESCFDDYKKFCTLLAATRRVREQDVTMIMRHTHDSTSRAHATSARLWAETVRRGFAAVVDPDSIYERSGISGSSAILLEKGGTVIDIAAFPLGRTRQMEVLQRFIQ